MGLLAFSPDGKRLTSDSGHFDSTTLLWDVAMDLWKQRACYIANRNLSPAEWPRFIGADVPYQRTCPDLPAGDGTAQATPTAPPAPAAPAARSTAVP